MNTHVLVGMMIAAALLVAPNATAGLVETDALLPEADVPELRSEVDNIAETTPELLACELAVHVPISLYGGNIVASRDNHLDVVVPVATVLDVVTEKVPIVATTTEVLWQPSGILAALPPITREITSIVGYEEQVSNVEEMDLDYNIRADWRDDKIAWERMDLDVFVTVSGASHLLFHDAVEVVQACDGEDVLPVLPAFNRYDGYQFVRAYIGEPEAAPESGWYARILGVDVSLADAADADKQRLDTTGFIVGPSDVVNQAQLGIDDVQAAILRGDIVVDQSSPEANTHANVDGAQGTPVAASGATIAAGIAGVVAAVGAAFAGRRFF